MAIALLKDETLDYCRQPPFGPPLQYPEYPFGDLCPGNGAYAAVRELFRRLGLDAGRYGLPSWNPLGALIRPGDHVFLKPNLVGHANPRGGLEALITQGCIVRCALDYAYIALRGRGKITIGDSPQMETDFAAAVRATGIDQIAGYYGVHASIPVQVLDLRQSRGRVRKIGGVATVKLPGDPLGYRAADLQGDSEHSDIIGDCRKFRVADYNQHEVARHHNPGRNEYCIAASVLDADVIVNLPKLKTHAKAGITGALKNLVGVNGRKDWLPHHRAGPAEEGGDEYIRRDWRKGLIVRLRDGMSSTNNLLLILPMRALNVALVLSRFAKPFNDPCLVGSWHGNDTLPRTIVDLNKVIFYADKEGVLRDAPQRRMFIIVDGIVAGEREGPMTPDARRCGVLLAGTDPVAVDAAASEIMGFDHRKIPTIKYALRPRRYALAEERVEDMAVMADRPVAFRDLFGLYGCGLVPPDGWRGHIEHEPLAKIEQKAEPIATAIVNIPV